MKQWMKRGTALAMALLMCISFVPVFHIDASAAESATVNYKYSTDGNNYVYNWGEREEEATFLSPMAEQFYKDENTSYDELSAYSGGTSQSNAPSSDLYKELRSLMAEAQDYETSYDDTRPLFKYTDCQNGGGRISSFYSGVEIGPDWDKGATWNREHTWPNSKGDASGNGENDIMMLRPASVRENSGRGNTAYGKSSGFYNPNSESGGNHDLRGDVSRIVLYVYVRWGNTSSAWGSNGVMESMEVLLEWMEADPVDTWELGRNDSVQSITGTRNVFVDYPELAFLLFGEDIPDMQTPSLEASGGCNHTYDNDCDADCNGCGAVREELTHTYDHSCDTVCNFCNQEREPGSHVYSAFCDATCENCGYEREASCRYAKWTVIVAATETEAGLEKSTCIYCKEETEREIPKLDPPKEEPEAPPAEDTPNEEQPATPPCINNGGAQEIPTESEPQGFFEAIAAFFQAIFDMIASLFKF